MRGVVLHAPGDIRVEDRADPRIEAPTDAIIRVSAGCVCGSDLWPYRGIQPVDGPMRMGHEYVGVVEEVGSGVTGLTPGQFVVGSFWASDNTCEICRAGYQSGCVHRVLMGTIGSQSEYARIPLSDGTLVATPEVPDAGLIPSYLAASDVLGTGWFGAVAAQAVAEAVTAAAWSSASSRRSSGWPGPAASTGALGSPPMRATRATPVRPCDSRRARVSVRIGVLRSTSTTATTRRGSSGSRLKSVTSPTRRPRSRGPPACRRR